jgi:hypothetical protein
MHPVVRKARETLARLEGIEERFAEENRRRDQQRPIIRRMGCALNRAAAEDERMKKERFAQSLVYKTTFTPTHEELEKRAAVKRARLFLWLRSLSRARRVLGKHKGSELIYKTHVNE